MIISIWKYSDAPKDRRILAEWEEGNLVIAEWQSVYVTRGVAGWVEEESPLDYDECAPLEDALHTNPPKRWADIATVLALS